MALRSRTDTLAPGRRPSTTRPRSRPGSRAPRRRPDPVAVRARAHELLGEPRRPAGPLPARGAPPPAERPRAESPAAESPAAEPPPAEPPSAVPAPVGSWERAGIALRERLPLWAQTRCGLEPRSLAVLGMVLTVAVGFAALHFWNGRPESVRAPEAVAANVAGDQATGPALDAMPEPAVGVSRSPSGGPVVVDVGGKVRSPGIRQLPAGSRVADALEAAGGVRPGTATDDLNKARILTDGEQILVGATAPPVPQGPAAATGTGGPISLNTATTEQLETLPGVGPVLAQRILDHRTEHGGFTSVDDLRQVNGIGDRRFADLRNRVRP